MFMLQESSGINIWAAWCCFCWHVAEERKIYLVLKQNLLQMRSEKVIRFYCPISKGRKPKNNIGLSLTFKVLQAFSILLTCRLKRVLSMFGGLKVGRKALEIFRMALLNKLVELSTCCLSSRSLKHYIRQDCTRFVTQELLRLTKARCLKLTDKCLVVTQRLVIEDPTTTWISVGHTQHSSRCTTSTWTTERRATSQ